MKIAIVTENFLPKVDGVTRTLARLLDRIQADGHEAILLGPSGYGGDYGKVKIIGTMGIPLFAYPGLKFNFFQLNLLQSLRDFQPDVIHFVDPIWFGPQMLLVCKLFLPHVPRVASYHTNIGLYFVHFGIPSLSSTVWRFQAFLHNQCERTLCPSSSTCEALVRHGWDPAKLVVWSRGVDLRVFTPKNRDPKLRRKWLGNDHYEFDESVDEGVSLHDTQKAIILYVGRVSWEKNLRVLVEAYRTLDHQACHLVIVGDGPARQEVATALADVPATFTGYLSGDALSRAYASGDIFASPSTSETFGQVNLEAGASGLPVVGFIAEGIKDIVQHERTGLLVSPSALREDSMDPVVTREYREALQRLISDADLRVRMGAAAVAASSAFTWEESMGSCIQTYYDVRQA